MWQELGNAFLEIFKAPFKEPSSLWVIVPLFLIWAVLVIYFDLHKKEKLGWNTALGNGLTLCWITLDLVRHLFLVKPDDIIFRFGLLLVILAYSIFIMYISFAHKIKSKFTFALSGPTPIYFLAIYAVMWGYNAIKVTWWVLLAMILLFLFIILIVFLLKKILPESMEDMSSFDEDSSFESSLNQSEPDMNSKMNLPKF